MTKEIKLETNVEIALIDHVTGKVLEKERVHNDIVNTGLERVAKLLNNVDGTYFRAIAIGSDNTAVQSTDTELGTEVTRATATLTYESSYKAKFVKTFTFGSGESYTIREAGVFDSSVASGSTMLNRFTFSDKSVDADTDIEITVTVTVATS